MSIVPRKKSKLDHKCDPPCSYCRKDNEDGLIAPIDSRLLQRIWKLIGNKEAR